MKIYSKKELNAKALEVFEQYPLEDKVFAREDGNIFFHENLAELNRGKMKVYPFDKNNIVKTDTAVDDTDLDEKINEAPVVEAPVVDKTLGKDGKSPETRKSNNKK